MGSVDVPVKERLPFMKLSFHVAFTLVLSIVTVAAAWRDAAAEPATRRAMPSSAASNRFLPNIREIVLLLRDFNSTAFANHRHLDLTRIFELVLDLARDLVR